MILIVKVDDPVIPIEPEIAVPTKVTGIEVDPVIDSPMEPVIDLPVS